MKTKFLLLCFCLISTCCFAQFQKSEFRISGNLLPYQVSYPKNYDASKKYPLLIFLHGAGERGDNNESQLVHGKDFLLNNTQEKFPAIVIVPQCPATSYWSNVKINKMGDGRTFTFGATDVPSLAMSSVMQLIEDWLASDLVDTQRVYLGGMSMGGMGTLELLWRMPKTFAAAFPICGGGDTSKVGKFAKSTPVWLFHGDADTVVDVQNSVDMYKALQKAGGETKYTEYPGVGHNSWDNVFQETELFSWLFAHTKK